MKRARKEVRRVGGFKVFVNRRTKTVQPTNWKQQSLWMSTAKKQEKS